MSIRPLLHHPPLHHRRHHHHHHNGLLLLDVVSSLRNTGLDAIAMKRLPIVLPPRPNRVADAAEETVCCICLGAFANGDKLKVLPGCDHSFHCEYVDKWLTNHSTCRLCRASVKIPVRCS